ncbi:MAG: YcxB family protein [Ectothiorhodospiraceae bacterium]|jgi:hypothetical protein
MSNPHDSSAREYAVSLGDDLLRATLRRFINRYIGWKFRAAAVVIAFAAALLLFQRDFSWYTWTLSALVVLSVVFLLLMHTVMFSLWVRQFRRIQDDSFTVRLDDNGIATRGANHGGSLEWRQINRVWRFPGAWLLFTASEHVTIVPTSGIDDSALDFIAGKVESNGGEVS